MRIPLIGEILTKADSLAVMRERELQKLKTENDYLKARIRAISHHCYKNKKGEVYLCVQSATGKFCKVQMPDLGE